MGYSGYVQLLCKNGHYDAFDVYDNYDVCLTCGESHVWKNNVDTTNGSFDDEDNRIDGKVELEIDKHEEFAECDKCHHKELVNTRTYKIPKEIK